MPRLFSSHSYQELVSADLEMFSSFYQEGIMGVEILTPVGTGKDGAGKFVGNVCREYERKIKGYMYLMGKESAGTSIHVPGTRGVTLGIRQSFLVMQMSTFETMNMSLDIAILDSLQRKYRMQFSNRFKKFVVNDLHAQIPWTIDSLKNDWFQIVFDLSKLATCCFGATFCSLDSFTLKPAMKVRNIFSLPSLADYDFSENTAKTLKGTPKSTAFPSSLQYRNIIFNDQTFMEIVNSLPLSFNKKNIGERSALSAPGTCKANALKVEGMSVGVNNTIKKNESTKSSSNTKLPPTNSEEKTSSKRDVSFDNCEEASFESEGNRDQLKLIKKKDQNMRFRKDAQAGGGSSTVITRTKAVLSEHKTLKGKNSKIKSTSPNKRYADVEVHLDEIHNFVVNAIDDSDIEQQQQENEDFNTTGQTSPSNPWGSSRTIAASKAPTFHSARKETHKEQEKGLYVYEDDNDNKLCGDQESSKDLLMVDAAEMDDISYQFDHIGVFNMKNDKIDKLEEILRLASNTLKRAEASYTEEFGSES